MITNDGKELISKFLIGQVPAFATHMSIGCGATPLDANDPIPNEAVSKTEMDFEIARVPISSKGYVDDSQTIVVISKERTDNVVTLGTLDNVPDTIEIGEVIVVYLQDEGYDGQWRISSKTESSISYEMIGEDLAKIDLAEENYGNVIVVRTKVSFTGNLPTAERYSITEIALWSADKNSLAGSFDSRAIFNFNQSWLQHFDDGSFTEPPVLNLVGPDIVFADAPAAFFAPTDALAFQVSNRRLRGEGPRNLNKTLLVRGDLSTINNGTGAWDQQGIVTEWFGSGSHIDLIGNYLNISGNNPTDILKFAFSVVDSIAIGTNPPQDGAKILVEFYENENNTDSNYAKLQIYAPAAALQQNSYFVANAQLDQSIDYSNYGIDAVEDLTKPYVTFSTTPNFSSATTNLCRIYAEVDGDNFLAFDGLRIDNKIENPVYKMTGYSIVRTDGSPIIKIANTNNYADFRFSLEV